jgi:NADH-quinone oxidoreductase subunit G
MARPERKDVTFEIDGREVTAAEGTMLVDAARRGDVEIPYFCYEPKLGPPVGACRMCLVEIEGIPKLQTSCSTPIKDGMVVHTTTERVKEAQNAIVEFLLVNHPLDCPVCDKGGECPLQDISYGWGPGRSRMIEPKRHFKKPLEVSPLVAIDRERCILCYRCVRYSQEIAEDYQLVFLERGDHTYVGTHDGRPYVAPFSGNIIELCPVGALTSTAYRFRARPWEVQEAGSVCSGCASQCNVRYTVRDDDKVLRVLARDNDEVDDGWICDKGRFGYESFHSPERVLAPMVRDGGFLREVSWERALDEAAKALAKGGERTAALAGGQTTNEEGFLAQHLLREGLGSPHVDAPSAGAIAPEQARVLARPELSARVSDIDHADAVLVIEVEPIDEAPVLDLRVRKARRRNGARVVTLTSRPSALDEPGVGLGADGSQSSALGEGGGAAGDPMVRFAPGAAEAALAALASALDSPLVEGRELATLVRNAGADEGEIQAAAAVLAEAGDVVVLWGGRTIQGGRGAQALDALLAIAAALKLGERPESGLIEVPSGANGRGLREVGAVAGLAPGLADASTPGMPTAEIGRALAGGELSTLLLLDVDPLRELPDRTTWDLALDRADDVIAFADFLTPGLEQHASVVFPAESNAEREGTLTHPDGRLQRVRQAIVHLGEVRPGWQVLAELCQRAGAGLDVLSAPMVTDLVASAVPFYAGITLEQIGGRGVRWQDRENASALSASELPERQLETPPELPDGLRLGAVPTLFASPAVDHSPSLRFLVPRQRAELSPADAQRLGIAAGDEVEVVAGERSVRATAALREAVQPGSVFLLDGIGEDGANALTNGVWPIVEVRHA